MVKKKRNPYQKYDWIWTFWLIRKKKTSWSWNFNKTNQFSPILFIQYKYRHNSFVSIFLFYINKVNPIPFGWFNSRIILLLSGNISSCYSQNDHLKRIYKRCFTLHNKYVHTQFLRMINISLSRIYNVHIEMSELI